MVSPKQTLQTSVQKLTDILLMVKLKQLYSKIQIHKYRPLLTSLSQYKVALPTTPLKLGVLGQKLGNEIKYCSHNLLFLKPK